MARQLNHSNSVYVGARVPSELRKRFKVIAERDHRTVSQEIRRLMEERVKAA